MSETIELSAAPAPTGIDAMMSALDTAAASGKLVAEASPPAAAKPAEPAAPATPAAAAPVPAAAAKPAETAKPAEPAGEQEPDWSKAPPKWYKIYESHKAKTGETIKSLETKLKALESKPNEAPGDAAKIKQFESELENLRKERDTYKSKTTERDFYESDEYKSKYAEPANRIYAEAVSFVEQLKTGENGDGPNGTSADLNRIRSTPLQNRKNVAKELFGDNAGEVLDFVKDIDRIKRDATMAAEKHSKEYESKSLERQTNETKAKQEYDGHLQSSLSGLKSNEKYGKWFSESTDDPEATTMLKNGFENVGKVLAEISNLPIEQQAAYSAYYRSAAAAMPRMILEINRRDAKIAAQEAELIKLRGSDPGAKPTGGVAPSGEAKPVGIHGAVSVFDQMPR